MATVNAELAIRLKEERDELKKAVRERAKIIASLLEINDRMLSLVQGIRIREVQAMKECGTWGKYKTQSDLDWAELNDIHRKSVEEYGGNP